MQLNAAMALIYVLLSPNYRLQRTFIRGVGNQYFKPVFTVCVYTGWGRRQNAAHRVILPTLLFRKTKILDVRLMVSFVGDTTEGGCRA